MQILDSSFRSWADWNRLDFGRGHPAHILVGIPVVKPSLPSPQFQLLGLRPFSPRQGLLLYDLRLTLPVMTVEVCLPSAARMKLPKLLKKRLLHYYRMWSKARHSSLAIFLLIPTPFLVCPSVSCLLVPVPSLGIVLLHDVFQPSDLSLCPPAIGLHVIGHSHDDPRSGTSS